MRVLGIYPIKRFGSGRLADKVVRTSLLMTRYPNMYKKLQAYFSDLKILFGATKVLSVLGACKAFRF